MSLETLLATASDDKARLSVLSRHASTVARTGDVEGALRFAAQADELAHQLGDARELGRSGCTRAVCEYLRADYVGAHKRCLESCTVAEHSGDREGLAAALVLAAACQYQMGALEEAHTALLQVLDIVDEAPDDELTFRAHNMLGMIFASQADHDAAQTQFELAIASGTRMGSEFYLQRARVNRAGLFRTIGIALRAEGREAEALARFREAAEACEAMRAHARGFASPENAAGCAGALGEICLQLGRAGEALALFDEMLRHGEAMGNLLIQAEALLHMGRHHLGCGNEALARDCLERALELAIRASARGMVVEVHEALARWCELRGDLPEALRRYKCYHELKVEHLRAELSAVSRVRAIWHEFLQARREAKNYRERFESLAQDNEELAKRATGLTQVAFEDSLTTLSNRRYLDLRLAELLGAPQGKAVRLSVAMLDVDFFKSINDRFSHRVGDDVLRAVATMIRTHCREGDVSARFGGDEFVICLIGTSLDAAQSTLERLRSFVANHDWGNTHPGLTVRVSIGVTQIRPGDDAAALLARADLALYRAKETGRNRICVD